MPATEDSTIYTELRKTAEARLMAGTSPANGHWSIGVDALRMLHSLSSDPLRANDALALLHELQVHQVELDLQVDEIAANEQSTGEDLTLYRSLFDAAPIGYFVVDFEGVITQGNVCAAKLFDTSPHRLENQHIETMLAPQNRHLVLEMLKRVATSGSRESCVVAADSSRLLHFVATKSPDNEHLLLACCDIDGAQHPRPVEQL